MLVDTHCHLNFKAFEGDRELVLDRAREAGVVRILNPGVDRDSSHEAVMLAESFEEVYAAVGVHPNESLSWDRDTIKSLSDMAAETKVVAIGEIGLDYYRDRAPKELQKQVFRDQLELAAELALPVVIHSRNASLDDLRAVDDIVSILTEWVYELNSNDSELIARPGVLHSFSSDSLTAERVGNFNFYLGITGPVTFRNADILREVVASTPLERQLIETDAPFLTPHPHRGKRNEPAYVKYVAEKTAQLHNKPYDIVVETTSKNAERLFNW